MTMAAAEAITIQGLSARNGGTSALDDVSLAIREHEIFGVMGQSGAGKSTLLKAIMMLAACDAGAIWIFGEPHHLPGSRSRLAYLPGRFQPPGHLFGHDFLRLTLMLHGRVAKRARTGAFAEQLGLDPSVLDQPIRGYSKGVAQRLGLLATLLTDLPILVLDQPLSGLDPDARRLVKRELAACRARGRTILLSSHIPSDHEGLCDRVSVLHEGRLRFVGSPNDLQARHRAPTLTSAFLAEIRERSSLQSAAP